MTRLDDMKREERGQDDHGLVIALASWRRFEATCQEDYDYACGRIRELETELRLRRAAERALHAHALPDWTRATFLQDPIGAALLALLCNAGAKSDPSLYADKSLLLRNAIQLADQWSAAPHGYGTLYKADTVVYIQTRIARFSFHVKRDDPELADLLSDAPTSGESWSGQRLQEHAREIALSWMEERNILVRANEDDPRARPLPMDGQDFHTFGEC